MKLWFIESYYAWKRLVKLAIGLPLRYADIPNFEEKVKQKRKEMEEEKKKYGRYLYSWEKP